jgi:hypothetical protein
LCDCLHIARSSVFCLSAFFFLVKPHLEIIQTRWRFPRSRRALRTTTPATRRRA